MERSVPSEENQAHIPWPDVHSLQNWIPAGPSSVNPLSSLHAFSPKLFQIRSFDCALLPILELTFVLEGNTSPGHVLNTAKWSITNFNMTRLAQPCGPGRPVPSQITHSVPVSQGVWGDSPRFPTVLEPCDPCFYPGPFPICASSQAMAVPEAAFLFHLSNAALPASCSISFLFWSQWFQLTVAMHDILATHIYCFFYQNHSTCQEYNRQYNLNKNSTPWGGRT